MKLTFLGTGSAFTVGDGNYHSNMLLQADDGSRLLIDCGSDIRFSLHELGLGHHDIQDVYISHLHADHVGGLEWLAFNTKCRPKEEKLRLFLDQSMKDNLWHKVLSGGLSGLEPEQFGLSSFFSVEQIDEKQQFNWQGIEFTLVKTVHVETLYGEMPSFGLFFEIAGTKIFITTDTQYNFPTLEPYYLQADIIFHDCETSTNLSGVHATFAQLCTLDEPIKNKMWLYHYQPGALPDAEGSGFLGFVNRGQSFNFSNNKIVTTALPEISEHHAVLIELEDSHKKQKQLLLNMLPEDVANELLARGSVEPLRFEETSVIFIDFIGFSKSATVMPPHDLIQALNDYFEKFDEIIEHYQIERIKTIGDGYMCVSGVPCFDPFHAQHSVAAALEIQKFMKTAAPAMKKKYGVEWQARIGIHSGPIVAGVVGKKRFAYDIWGETVNVANRMEAQGIAGEVNISAATYELIKQSFTVEPRGCLPIHKRGVIEMYLDMFLVKGF